MTTHSGSGQLCADLPDGPSLRWTPACLAAILACASLLGVAATPAGADSALQDPEPAAQEIDPEAAEEDVPAEAVAPPPPPDYLLPDLPAATLIREGQRYWFKPIFAVVLDYTTFEQDETSLAQVGLQDDTGELRAGRIGFTLRSKREFSWDLYFTSDYQERATREKTAFTIYDLRIGLPLGDNVRFNIGKQKQFFVYELATLSVILPQQERVLLPFFVSRSIGAQFWGQLAGDRMIWTAGVFNDWLDTGVDMEKNPTDYVGRLTGLAWTTPGDRDYLHLGLGYRRVGSKDGIMRFSGRPESNVADKYVDTGNFPGDHADEISLEALWVKGPFEILAEHIQADVDSPETGDPGFSGYYAAASWFLTGEGRQYFRKGGYAVGVVPKRRMGAWELVAKYSHVDLTDGTLDGGELDKWNFGLNWWISREWKTGISYGDADLDKGGLLGNTRMVLLRFQWIY